MRMLNEIAIPDNAKPWLEEALTAGQEIVGLGHHVCKSGDSRVATMRAVLGVIAGLRSGQHLVETCDAFATAVHEATGLRPTLDCLIGPAYHLVGLDASAFTPVLVAASTHGWTARMAGQLGPDSLIRPLAADDGSADRRPAAEREEHVRSVG
jgi:citrate synthase